MSEELKQCQHGRIFCMECHYADLPPEKNLPKMYDDLLADNAKLRAQLHSLQGAGEVIYKPSIVAFMHSPEFYEPYVGISRDTSCDCIDPLMTVKQHERIVAAVTRPADPDMVQVPRELLSEVIEIFSSNNWRGDIQEQIRDMIECDAQITSWSQISAQDGEN